MNQHSKRFFLKNIVVLLFTLGPSIKSFAAKWNKEAFNADNLSRSFGLLGIVNVRQTDQIELKVPQIAENGTIVPIEIFSSIPKTQNIYIFVEKNPSPLTSSFFFSTKTLPFLSTRIKMRESSKLTVVVKTKEHKFFSTQREVKVTIGGCGEEE